MFILPRNSVWSFDGYFRSVIGHSVLLTTVNVRQWPWPIADSCISVQAKQCENGLRCPPTHLPSVTAELVTQSWEISDWPTSHNARVYDSVKITYQLQLNAMQNYTLSGPMYGRAHDMGWSLSFSKINFIKNWLNLFSSVKVPVVSN